LIADPVKFVPVNLELLLKMAVNVKFKPMLLLVHVNLVLLIAKPAYKMVKINALLVEEIETKIVLCALANWDFKKLKEEWTVNLVLIISQLI
jgi:hypothetical protein